LRTDYALYLYEPVAQEEESKSLGNPAGFITPGLDDRELVKALKVKIGGVAGLGSSEATAVI